MAGIAFDVEGRRALEGAGDSVGFEQASIPIENEAAYYALREAVERVFSSPEDFFRGLKRAGVKVRQFERVLDLKLLERADAGLAKAGRPARELYDALALSDKSQLREFYLVRLEKVGDEARERFAAIYRDY